ncbi:hypothetical protein PsAD14_03903 [Pseudovibrio sp. Ad14]|nr:hypothetical protein PsW74_01008 [Pseudovibrio sp. W74]KZL07517.1 hypothetical protein PsAD14_03903 [Pseudovibrio sp. Ad14]
MPFPIIFTVNCFRMWQLYLFGSAPVLYGPSLQQENEQ